MNVLNKLKNQLGFDDDNYELYDDEIIVDRDEKEDTKELENVIKPGAFNRKIESTTPRFSSDSNFNNIHRVDTKTKVNSNPSQVINVVKPTKFEEASKVAQDIIKGNIIVLNTAQLDLKFAQRFLDFICGTAYAMDGEVINVSENIYLISPKNVDVNDTIARGNTLKNLFNIQ